MSSKMPPPPRKEQTKVFDASYEAREKRAASWVYKAPNQNPMYTTSAHEIGAKQPAAHEFPDKMYPMLNEFSGTFGGLQYRDHGLNCSLPKAGYVDDGSNAW